MEATIHLVRFGEGAPGDPPGCSGSPTAWGTGRCAAIMRSPQQVAFPLQERAGRDIVPVQRWMYLDKADVVAHGPPAGISTWGPKLRIAERLHVMGKVTYSRVRHCSLLRQMLKREGLDDKGERRILEHRLMQNPPPAEPPPVPPPPAQPKSTAATPPGYKIAIKDNVPTTWKKELERIAAAQLARGSTLVSGSHSPASLCDMLGPALCLPLQASEAFEASYHRPQPPPVHSPSTLAHAIMLHLQTKELCAVYLTEWGKLPEDFAVYHIISPAAGGKDHPANYAMLPNYFPSDYHIEGKVELHHAMMLELLGKANLLLALKAGMQGAAADTEANERYESIKKAVEELKGTLKCCAKGKASAGGGAAAPRGPTLMADGSAPEADGLPSMDAGNGGVGDPGAGPSAGHAPGDCNAETPGAKRRRPADGIDREDVAATPPTAMPAEPSMPVRAT